MLANRLAILLAERDITIKKVTEDTGLSRNTVSNLVNNPRGNVSILTTDTLCNYLGVEPKDFFEYSSVQIAYKLNEEKIVKGIRIRKYGRPTRFYDVTYSLASKDPDLHRLAYNEGTSFDWYATMAVSEGFDESAYRKITPRFQKLVLDDLNSSFDRYVFKSLNEKMKNGEIRLDKAISVSSSLVISASQRFISNHRFGPNFPIYD